MRKGLFEVADDRCGYIMLGARSSLLARWEALRALGKL